MSWTASPATPTAVSYCSDPLRKRFTASHPQALTSSTNLVVNSSRNKIGGRLRRQSRSFQLIDDGVFHSCGRRRRRRSNAEVRLARQLRREREAKQPTIARTHAHARIRPALRRTYAALLRPAAVQSTTVRAEKSCTTAEVTY